jgi:hypothetical protein
MQKYIRAALFGAALVIPASNILFSNPVFAADDLAVRACVKQIAKLERDIARRTKGKKRREIIAVLGQAKLACIKGDFELADQGAIKGRFMANKAGKK